MKRLDEFRYLVLAAQREGNRLLASALRPLAVTPAQAEVAAVLRAFAPLSLSRLGDLLVCEAQSPSRLVAGLVARGMVMRAPAKHDRRAVKLQLTRAGHKLAAAVTKVERAFAARIRAALTGMSVAHANQVLWAFVAELPAGKALRRRGGKPPRPRAT